MATDANGRVIVSGFSGSNLSAIQFLSNGTLDTAFGSGGIASVGVGGLVQGRQGIRLGMDGRIYLAGATDSNLLVARFNTSGYLDASFGASGVASVTVGSYMDAAGAIDIGPDGKVTIAGGADDGVSGNFVTARFTVADIPRRIFVQQDANHNVTSLTDLYGAMLERFVEDPYGDRIVLTPSFGSTTDVYNMVYGFQGGRSTPADGLYHFNARDYDVNLGRWISQDPIGYPDGANRYAVDMSSPGAYADSTGLAPKPTTLPFGDGNAIGQGGGSYGNYGKRSASSTSGKRSIEYARTDKDVYTEGSEGTLTVKLSGAAPAGRFTDIDLQVDDAAKLQIPDAKRQMNAKALKENLKDLRARNDAHEFKSNKDYQRAFKIAYEDSKYDNLYENRVFPDSDTLHFRLETKKCGDVIMTVTLKETLIDAKDPEGPSSDQYQVHLKIKAKGTATTATTK